MVQEDRPAMAARRAQSYNACVASLRRIHKELMILRVRWDDGRLVHEAGQYTVLGLGAWEPLIAGMQDEPGETENQEQLVRRAYSFSCRLLDEQARLVGPADEQEAEFYITLAAQAPRRRPGLTPRLFCLREADRLYVGPRARGNYLLTGIAPDQTVVLVATGTGEAPHNAMVAQLLTQGHRGRIVTVTCVRQRQDLGYLATHRQLEQRFPNYRYLVLTTREPENLDPAHPGYIGKQYLQEYFASGRLARDAGVPLAPGTTHVFLCGNPEMIGLPEHPRRRVGPMRSTRGMIQLLEEAGFQIDRPQQPGNVHFERYW